MLVFLLQGAGFGLSAAVQPGPFQTYLISQTLERGWRRTLPAALAPLISDGPIIALVLVVLSQVPVWFQRVLYLAGGLFVLYLAWSSLQAYRDFDSEGLIQVGEGGGSVLKAALMNALSPGPYIYWSLITGPILVSAWHQAPSLGIAFLVGLYETMVSSLVLLIVVFGTARQLGPGVNRALLGISAAALFVFGLYQLWQGSWGWR